MRTNQWLIKKCSRSHRVELFAISPHDHLAVHVPVPGSVVGWEQSRWLLVPTPALVAYYFSLLLCASKADKAQVCMIATTAFLFLALVSLVGATPDGFSFQRPPTSVLLWIALVC